MIKNNFRWLLLAALKRDLRVMIVWLVVNVMMVVSGVSKLATLYNTPSEVASLKSMLNSPMVAALFGRLPVSHQMTTAILFAALMMAMMGVLVALMNIQLATRGTRGDEDSGATELIRSRAVKATQPVLVVVTELIIVNGLLAGLIFAGSMLIRMNGANLTGYALFALALAIFGLMFGAITVLAAQLFADARTTAFALYGLLILTYGLRSVIDGASHYPSWHYLSPFNWLEDMQIFAQNNLSYLWPMIIVILLMFTTSYYLVGRRDLGAGYWQFREHGRDKASFALRGYATLFIRLEQKVVWGWTLALLFLGGMYGGLFVQVGKMVDTSPELQQIMGLKVLHQMQNKVYESFLAMIIVFMAAMAIFAALMVMQRQNKDAHSGAYDLLSGTRVTRRRLFLTYTIGGLLTGLFTWTIGILTLWFAARQSVGHALPDAMFTKALFGYMPTIVLAVGIIALVVGWFPQIIGALYGYFGIFFLLTYMKEMFHIPLGLLKLAPFGWTYQLPVVTVHTGMLLGLIGVAVVLMVLGYIGYHRRDLV